MGRVQDAFDRFDAANAEDPRTIGVDGAMRPYEVVYAERMTAWLERFAPDARDTVKLAARAQHIKRWTVPRADYPKDRRGYRAWRTALAAFHAETAGAILAEVGYQPETIASVQALLRKEGLGTDEDAQLLEDVICLVFFEHYLADFVAEHDETKVVRILAKTWAKMSEQAHSAALGLELAPQVRALVERALADSPKREG